MQFQNFIYKTITMSSRTKRKGKSRTTKEPTPDLMNVHLGSITYVDKNLTIFNVDDIDEDTPSPLITYGSTNKDFKLDKIENKRIDV